MKKLLIICAAVAVAMTGCNKGAKTTTADAAGDAVPREVSSQIAYIQLDSLMAGYNMFTDLSAEFEKKAKEVENDLNSRKRALEKAFADAQNKVEKGLVTRNEAAQLQEDMQRREQAFYQVSETKQRELQEENQVMMNKIFNSLNEYIAEFNADYRYGMIITTSGGAPVLHADPQLNITALVKAGLNEKYAKEKKTKSTT